MSKLVYDRIANGCCLTAVGSAFLFGHAGEWQGVVGTIGVLAGAVAVVSYFYNQWHTEKEIIPLEQKGGMVDIPLAQPRHSEETAVNRAIRYSRLFEAQGKIREGSKRVYLIPLARQPIRVGARFDLSVVEIPESDDFGAWESLRGMEIEQPPQYDFMITQGGERIVRRPTKKGRIGEHMRREDLLPVWVNFPPNDPSLRVGH